MALRRRKNKKSNKPRKKVSEMILEYARDFIGMGETVEERQEY